MTEITKIILKNFKSFKKAELPIKKGFTSIVGSNGSGKSNILDSLLFVLGSTSLKTMRASKLAELINTHTVENYAKVEIHISEAGKTYKISRMIDNKGRSQFRLNDERTTLGEINSLMLGLGIKNDRHNIVTQGDVADIIKMSDIQRREIIDEVAGLSEFDSKKEETLKELKKVEEKIKDTNIVLAERENYLSELEEDMQAMKEFNNLHERKKRLKTTILSKEMKEILERKEKNTKKIEESKKEIEKIEKEINEHRIKEKELKQKAEELNSLILESSQKTYSEILKKAEDKRSEKTIAEQRINSKNELIDSNKQRIIELTKKTEGLEEQQNLFINRQKEIEKELIELKEKLNSAEGEKEKLLKERNVFEETFLKIQEELKEKTKEYDSKKEIWIDARNSIETAEKNNKIIIERLKEIETRINNLTNEIEEKQELKLELEKLKIKHPSPENELKEFEKKLELNIEKEKQGTAEVTEIKKAIIELQKDISLCPICESSLEKNKKKQLLDKKINEEKKITSLINETTKQRPEIKKSIEELKNDINKMTELSLKIKNLNELTSERNLLAEKKIKIKNSIQEKDMLETALETAQREMEISLKEKQNIEEKISTARKSFSANEIEEEINKFNELEKKKALLEQEMNSIKLSLDRITQTDIEGIISEKNVLEEKNNSFIQEIELEQTAIKLIEKELIEIEAELDKAKNENDKRMKEKEGIAEKITIIEGKRNDNYRKIKQLEKEEQAFNIEISKDEVRIVDLEEEFKEYENEKLITGMSLDELKKEIPEIDKKIEKLGAINMKATESFDELKEELEDIKKKVQILEDEKQAVLDMVNQIDFKRNNVFMECFNKINMNFRKMFFNFFEGDGTLSLENPEEPLESGLYIEAKHKGEGLKNIDAMSGGEKTLTALAFLFAIQFYEPAPFYVFDEADAALDKVNSTKLGKVIKELSKQSQFIAITHNDSLVKEADQIIGVAMTKAKSSVIGLDLKDKILPTKTI